MTEIDGTGYARGGGDTATPVSYDNQHFRLVSSTSPARVSVCPGSPPQPTPPAHPAHAPSVWTDLSSRPLCEVLGRLEPEEWPWYAIVPAGVRCPDCLEWMHA